jgi:hypothetical protein
MQDADVRNLYTLGQSTVFSQSIQGGVPVAWVQQGPIENFELDFVGNYGVYFTSKNSYADGTKVTASAGKAATLGYTYTWNGSYFEQGAASNPQLQNSVQILNQTEGNACFGLTKQKDGTYSPVTIATIAAGQQVTFTPQETIYAKTGRNYQAGQVIVDIGNLNSFVLLANSMNELTFDSKTSNWVKK